MKFGFYLYIYQLIFICVIHLRTETHESGQLDYLTPCGQAHSHVLEKKNVLWETTIARSDRLLTVFSNLELYTVAGLVLNENVKTVKIKVSKSMTQKFINTSERNCP